MKPHVVVFEGSHPITLKRFKKWANIVLHLGISAPLPTIKPNKIFVMLKRLKRFNEFGVNKLLS